MKRWTARIMVCALVLAWGQAAPAFAQADETLYRYEGNVRPDDASAGWICGNPCEDPCSESVEDHGSVLTRYGGHIGPCPDRRSGRLFPLVGVEAVCECLAG